MAESLPKLGEDYVPIDVTFMISPGTFWVVSTSEKDQDFYASLEQDLTEDIERAMLLKPRNRMLDPKFEPQKGDIVSVKSEHNQYWYRAVVEQVCHCYPKSYELEYKVFLIDRGIVITVHESAIQSLPEVYHADIRGATRMFLYGIVPITMEFDIGSGKPGYHIYTDVWDPSTYHFVAENLKKSCSFFMRCYDSECQFLEDAKFGELFLILDTSDMVSLGDLLVADRYAAYQETYFQDQVFNQVERDRVARVFGSGPKLGLSCEPWQREVVAIPKPKPEFTPNLGLFTRQLSPSEEPEEDFTFSEPDGLPFIPTRLLGLPAAPEVKQVSAVEVARRQQEALARAARVRQLRELCDWPPLDPNATCNIDVLPSDNPGTPEEPNLFDLLRAGAMRMKAENAERWAAEHAKDPDYVPEPEWACLAVDVDSQVFFDSGTNPGQLFIRLKANNEKLTALEKRIQDYVANCKDDKIGKFKGSYCIGQFVDDSLWYRAKVISRPTGETAELFFVDHGETRTVAVATATRPLVKFMVADLPFQAIECQLVGVQPNDRGNWEDTAVDMLYDLTADFDGVSVELNARVFGQDAVAQMTGGRKQSVVLYYNMPGLSQVSVVNKILIETRLARPKPDELEHLCTVGAK